MLVFYFNGCGSGNNHFAICRPRGTITPPPADTSATKCTANSCHQSDYSHFRLPSVHRQSRVNACLTAYLLEGWGGGNTAFYRSNPYLGVSSHGFPTCGDVLTLNRTEQLRAVAFSVIFSPRTNLIGPLHAFAMQTTMRLSQHGYAQRREKAEVEGHVPTCRPFLSCALVQGSCSGQYRYRDGRC